MQAASRLSVALIDGHTVDADRIGYDAATDLALIRTQDSGQPHRQGSAPRLTSYFPAPGSTIILCMPRLSFTPNLRRRIRCPDADMPADSVGQLFERYFAQHPDVRGYVLDDQGAVRQHIMILVDGLNLRDRRTQRDRLTPDSEVFVFQALSGG